MKTSAAHILLIRWITVILMVKIVPMKIAIPQRLQVQLWAPVTDTQWVLHVYNLQGLPGPASAVLIWHRTPRGAARRLHVLQHARHIMGAPSEVSHWANELANKLHHLHWQFTFEWQSIFTLDWQSLCVINVTAPTAVSNAVTNVSSGTYWT